MSHRSHPTKLVSLSMTALERSLSIYRTPPNVMFEVDDAASDWTFPEDHFDFIHARTIGGGIRDWPALLERCYRHIKPGGKIEISEGRANFYCDDGTMEPDSYTTKWLVSY